MYHQFCTITLSVIFYTSLTVQSHHERMFVCLTFPKKYHTGELRKRKSTMMPVIYRLTTSPASRLWLISLLDAAVTMF